MRRIAFWYDFASTYSYLSAMRIEALATPRGIAVDWRPFLLGPIFASQGWTTSPFNLYPAKGRYMIRDLERLAADRGLAFRMPDPFPQHSVRAARVALAAAESNAIAEVTRAIFAAAFGTGAGISEKANLLRILDEHRLDSARLLERSESPFIKDGLRHQTADAQSRGLFGAPTFVTADGEIFWGDDRLEQALERAAKL